MKTLLNSIGSLFLIPFALLLLVLLYCMAWAFGGREWREFLTGRDLEHD